MKYEITHDFAQRSINYIFKSIGPIADAYPLIEEIKAFKPVEDVIKAKRRSIKRKPKEEKSQ